jgi:2-polyprenyl-3-methyl-5-hydroxy-6-metoxy-1,4-benzoquinol methylase
MQRVECGSCGARELESVLALGSVPLVNALVEPGDAKSEPRYPLAIVRCARCTLVQITETVAPEALFRRYAYFSSYSDTFLAHARRFAEHSMRELASKSDAFVVEVASNDGYLLQYFVAEGVRSLGIEPAENVALVARERGVETISEFLNEELASQIVLDHGVADLVIANNVLAHVPDLHGFVRGLRVLAGARGSIVVEVPYLCDLIDQLEFDTIYHEHVSYFTLTSLARLFEPHGLKIVSAERLPVHG